MARNREPLRTGEPAGAGNGGVVPPPEHRFQPGQSGNPGGRPRGLARKVRDVLGNDDGETVARFWAAVMSGVLVSNVAVLDDAGAPTGQTRRVEEKVSMADRLAASKLLAERGWGKPPQFAPIEDEDPLDFSERESNRLAAELDARLDELAERRQKRATSAG